MKVQTEKNNLKKETSVNIKEINYPYVIGNM